MITLQEILAKLEAANLTNIAKELSFRSDDIEVFEFKPEYNNGTGYFDNLVHEEFEYKLDVVSQKTYVSADTHGRVIILVPMPNKLGNVVLFQRYVNSDVLVSNNPRELENLFASAISHDIALKVIDGSIANMINKLLNSKKAK